jgi:CheY-like chemotaxis protein
VLIVDDEPMLTSMLASMLGGHFAVETASSGTQALERLQSGARFDVILCDVMMPAMNGVDLHDAVTRRFPEHAPAFVFMTGGVRGDELQARLDATGAPRLAKPFTLDQLLARVSERTGP